MVWIFSAVTRVSMSTSPRFAAAASWAVRAATAFQAARSRKSSSDHVVFRALSPASSFRFPQMRLKSLYVSRSPADHSVSGVSHAITGPPPCR